MRTVDMTMHSFKIPRHLSTIFMLNLWSDHVYRFNSTHFTASRQQVRPLRSQTPNKMVGHCQTRVVRPSRATRRRRAEADGPRRRRSSTSRPASRTGTAPCCRPRSCSRGARPRPPARGQVDEQCPAMRDVSVGGTASEQQKL